MGLPATTWLRLGQPPAQGLIVWLDLTTLKATVNAFTHLWLGVWLEMGLSFTTDALEGLRLPEPKVDWDF